MPGYIRISLFSLIIIMFSAFSAKADCPAGDLNGDCRIDLSDVQVFAQQWLLPSGDTSLPAQSADLDGVDGVDLSDFALLTKNWHEVGTPLFINEFLASNSSTMRDPQGQYDDWIEIHNAGAAPINIAGMYLTDDLNRPTIWRIPGNEPSLTTIPAKGYVLIWADGQTTDWGLHANFKLDADGEQIGLFDRDGVTLIHSVTFPNQTSNMSYGCFPDGSSDWRFFPNPTPGAKNNEAYLGEVEAPKLSQKHGFYDAPFLLTLATETKDATIYYSLDGTIPHEFVGRFPTGATYTGPILINKTTCLRTRALKPGWKPSDIKSATFLFGVSQSLKSLPIISLVGDVGKTFYEPDGIMAIVGGSYSGDGQWFSDGPNSYNNPMQRGMKYERPVSFEWISPGDNSGFQVDCGIRVHGSDYMRPRYRRSDGNWSGNTKFSLRLYFRDSYGQSWLDYPLFPFEVERFKSIVLRGGHNDNVNPFIKDELIRRLHKDMGTVDSGGTMANLFINGQYKGYYNPCDHIGEAFVQQWYKSDKAWDVMTMSGVRDGDAISWNEMLDYARNHNLAEDAHYREVARRLDIPAFADYLILQLWNGNWDWPQNNWSAARERSEQGKWRFFIWDAEGAIFSDRLTTVYFDRLNTQSNALGYLYRALKVNSTFRQLFSDRINEHFFNDGALTETNIKKRFYELRDQMLGVISNMDTYLLNTWVPNRLDIFLNACVQEGVFTLAGPTFNINGLYQHGGHVSSGDLLSIVDHGRFFVVHYSLDGTDPYRPDAPPPVDTSDVLLAAENAIKRALIPVRAVDDNWRKSTTFNDSVWLYGAGSPGGIGYEKESGYEGLISLNVGTQMYGKNATCFIRIPFTFSGDPAGFKTMTLNVRYDDGFIAYLNGVELARRNVGRTYSWNSSASAEHPDAEAAQFESIDVSALLSNLQPGSNLLAIHGLNSSASDADFLISVELIAGRGDAGGDTVPGATQYTSPIPLTKSSHVKARILNGATWSALTEATFAVGPVAQNLRITEIMYHPQSAPDANDPNEEFIELTNIGSQALNLNLVRFTNGIDFTFPDMELAPGQRTIVVQDRNIFEARYGRNINIAGQYSGQLNNAGERITLADAAGQTILDFKYSDGWRSLTDGEGFSLTIINPANPDLSAWDTKDAWRASAYAGGSPGSDDSGIIPNPGAIVINEVLSHAHAQASDWIELHNTTSAAINIGGWFLSDEKDKLLKYQLANGTTISANGYLVLYQDLHFGNANASGVREPFALSENGESLYLSSAQNGVITGYREAEDFGASITGVSFGRYYRASTDDYNFVAMEQNTPGAANAYPMVGSIVISEIMYHPDWPVGGSYTNDQYEYIELYNISSQPVALYDYVTREPWKFTNGIEFTFPSDVPVTIPAGGYLIIAQKPEAFMWRYPAVLAAKVLGPYDGKLSDAGESLELSMPGDVDTEGKRYYIRVDRVNYSDGSALGDLWPPEADGLGFSLTRKVPSEYGNDAANWIASAPSPGR